MGFCLRRGRGMFTVGMIAPRFWRDGASLRRVR